MELTIRVDLDYVPWDTPDAQEFGHGEPAEVLRLLELARQLGVNLHFFASNRVLRAFPSQLEAILSDGHDVDWLCKHPLRMAERYPVAEAEFAKLGHPAQGLAIRESWPDDAVAPPELRFLSSRASEGPAGLTHFPILVPTDREASRAGQSARLWGENIRAQLRTLASLNRSAALCVRPQVLAKFDPRLNVLRDLLPFAQGLGMEIRTFRERLQSL